MKKELVLGLYDEMIHYNDEFLKSAGITKKEMGFKDKSVTFRLPK